MTMQPNEYLKDVVARRLAERGLPGRVEVRPHRPLAERLELGERARFIVEYDGVESARLVLDEWQISGGTRGAPISAALAEMIEREVGRNRVAAA
jgi:hypothetical protein